MKTDYKFWYIKQDDDGFITEAAVRYYEGDVTTEDEVIVKGEPPVPVTKYRRTARLTSDELTHVTKEIIKESNNNDAVLYTQSDFGQITTIDELRTYLNDELSNDKDREAVDEQK